MFTFFNAKFPGSRTCPILTVNIFSLFPTPLFRLHICNEHLIEEQRLPVVTLLNHVNARLKFPHTRKCKNVQKTSVRFTIKYMGFMTGYLLPCTYANLSRKKKNAKPSLPVSFCVWQARNICTLFFLQTVSTQYLENAESFHN